MVRLDSLMPDACDAGLGETFCLKSEGADERPLADNDSSRLFWIRSDDRRQSRHDLRDRHRNRLGGGRHLQDGYRHADALH